MSHIATIKIEVRSLDALQRACDRLGLTFVEGQTTYQWYGHWVGDYPLPDGVTVDQLGKCDHAIKVPGANYEVGVVAQEGRYQLLWDFYSDGGLEAALGPNGERLVQAYAIEAAKLEAELQGHVVWEDQPSENGTVKLHVEVMA